MAIRYITCCLWTVVSTSLSRTVFKTLPLLKWTWLPVTLRTPSFLTTKLKLQATYPVVKSRFIYELQVLQRFQTTKVIFKFTQGHRQSGHSIAHIWLVWTSHPLKYMYIWVTSAAHPIPAQHVCEWWWSGVARRERTSKKRSQRKGRFSLWPMAAILDLPFKKNYDHVVTNHIGDFSSTGSNWLISSEKISEHKIGHGTILFVYRNTVGYEDGKQLQLAGYRLHVVNRAPSRKRSCKS